MSILKPLQLLTLTSVSLLALGSARPGLAHEKGVLSLPSRSLPVGATVSLRGAKFAADLRLALILTGMGGRTTLAEVRADSAGRFVHELSIPGDLVPGPYRLVAVAPDGDVVAGLDLELIPAVMTQAPMAEVPHDAHTMPGAEAQRTPGADPLVLARAKSPLVTVGALGVMVAALALGVVMLRRSAKRGHAA
ncbi:MAG TPA: hypothetical protein VGA42_02255 [Gemmatimonadales bacterium]